MLVVFSSWMIVHTSSLAGPIRKKATGSLSMDASQITLSGSSIHSSHSFWLNASAMKKSGDPFLVDFDGSINCSRLSKNLFGIVRDHDIEAFNFLFAGFCVFTAGWILTVLEGFFYESFLNVLEHMFYAVGAILVAIWCWKVYGKVRVNK